MNHRVLVLVLVVAIGALCMSVAVAASPAAATPMHAGPLTVVRAQSVPLPPYPLRCVVTASNVNYRRGPGRQYASYGQLRRGFTFASGGEVRNPQGPQDHYEYWEVMQRPGHADAYVDDDYVLCWLPRSA